MLERDRGQTTIAGREKSVNNYLILDHQRLAEIAHLALDAYINKKYIFANPEVKTPENSFMKLLENEGKKRDSSTYSLHGLFFFMMTLFADNSTDQLNRVASPTRFEKYKEVFNIDWIIGNDEAFVRQTVWEYIRLSYNKWALDGWRHNAEVIKNRYDGDLKNFFAEHDNHAPSILEALADKKKKSGLIRFGPKLGTLFLLWANEYGFVDLSESEKLGIPVDVQVMRISMQTDALKPSNGQIRIHKNHISDMLIPAYQSLGLEISRNEGHKPIDLANSLWLVGHHCCNRLRHDSCPLANECFRLISRNPFDQYGVIEVVDTGRNETPETQRKLKKQRREIEAGQQQLPMPEELIRHF